MPNLDIKLLVPKRDDSLLAHTFQDFEIVVVDDYSTDSSCKVIESYEPKFDGRLRPHRLKENSGSGGVPRNKGNLLFNGEYIKFLDADDMLTNTALAELYSLANEIFFPQIYPSEDLVWSYSLSPKPLQTGRLT